MSFRPSWLQEEIGMEHMQRVDSPLGIRANRLIHWFTTQSGESTGYRYFCTGRGKLGKCKTCHLLQLQLFQTSCSSTTAPDVLYFSYRQIGDCGISNVRVRVVILYVSLYLVPGTVRRLNHPPAVTRSVVPKAKIFVSNLL